jgi:DNA-binding transcriptional regulator GbsR (MarR family)
VYLSQTPVSCTQLTEQLSLSKALISPALKELCQYRLIHVVSSPNQKTKLYAPVENINQVIRDVLKNREAKMLQQISKDFSDVDSSENPSSVINKKRLKSLGKMILSANFLLELLVAKKNLGLHL